MKNFVVKVRKDGWYSTGARGNITYETIGEVLTDFESTGEVVCERKYTNFSNTRLSGKIICKILCPIKRKGKFTNIKGDMFLVLFQDEDQDGFKDDDIQFGIQYTAENEHRVEPCYLEANIMKNSAAAIGNLLARNAGGRRSSRKQKSRIHAGVLMSRKRRKSGRKKHRSKKYRRT